MKSSFQKFKSVSIESFFSLIGATTVAILAGIISYYFTAPADKELKQKIISQYERAVIQVLKDGNTADIGSLKLLYEAVTKRKKESLEFQTGFREALIKINFDIASGNYEQQDPEKRKQWNGILKEALNKYDEKSPYHGLHPVEGAIFQDLSNLNSDPNVEKKLHQLASVERARFEELEKTKKEARWSLIFGIAGVVGAITSIILSLIQTIRRPNNSINSDKNG